MVSNIKFFFNKNDIENIGYVFKVSYDIVYARGLLKVQILEVVKFEFNMYDYNIYAKSKQCIFFNNLLFIYLNFLFLCLLKNLFFKII